MLIRYLIVSLLAVNPLLVQGQGFFQRTQKPGAIVGYSLIDHDTKQIIGTVNDGDTFTVMDPDQRFSIISTTIGSVGSVEISVGPQVRTNDVEPFEIQVTRYVGDGPTTLSATPYFEEDGEGFVGDTYGVTFELALAESAIPSLSPSESMEPTKITVETAGPTMSVDVTHAPTIVPTTPPLETGQPTEVTGDLPTTTPVFIDTTACDTDPEFIDVDDDDVLPYFANADGFVSGVLRKWHKITLGFKGPVTCERAVPNPFTDYSLEVTFTSQRSGESVKVLGYYAADGNAANTGSSRGDVWLTHFTPNDRGMWTWTANFTYGEKVAMNGGGVSAGFFDGATGAFDLRASNAQGRDLRGKGLLQYVGEHHLQFAETGEWFLKAGADSPENLLAYDDFDNTPNNRGIQEFGLLKSWEPHQQDYNEGDPTFANGKGTEIIGAINYLSEQGMNVFSFLTMNIGGDDRNVFPYVSDQAEDRLRIDVSKTAQWEVLFEHADHIGMYLHFKTQETENESLLDGGELGEERKLYYRELIARFGHHLALNWNIGEESSNTNSQRKDFGEFIREMDPYDHLIVVHTFPDQKERRYEPLLGNRDFDGASLQSDKELVFNDTLTWVTRSAEAGRKWVVANDEQGSARNGVVPDENDRDHDVVRKEVLWGNIMAGGAGVEYYFGYDFDNSDVTAQDFRSRANLWAQSKVALDFFSVFEVPFWEMSNSNSTVSGDTNWALVQASGAMVVLFLKEGGTATVDLSAFPETVYSVQWYDPRVGGSLEAGSVSTVQGTGAPIGNAPGDATLDWVVLLNATATSTSFLGF